MHRCCIATIGTLAAVLWTKSLVMSNEATLGSSTTYDQLGPPAVDCTSLDHQLTAKIFSGPPAATFVQPGTPSTSQGNCWGPIRYADYQTAAHKSYCNSDPIPLEMVRQAATPTQQHRTKRYAVKPTTAVINFHA